MSNERHLIPMTDDRGKPLLPPDQMGEPTEGSVVLTSGIHGSAWQRHYSDGLWHCAGARPKTWARLVQSRNLVLVYDAPARMHVVPKGLRR